MALGLDGRGLLPPGVHDASLEEVAELFGRFQRSDRRLMLLGKLRRYLDALQKSKCAVAVILDGSLVMSAVDEPEDIDMIVVLTADWDLSAELRPFAYNMVSKRRVKQEYGIEIVAVPVGSPHEQEWTDFFGRVNTKWCEAFGWPAELKKGLVRISL